MRKFVLWSLIAAVAAAMALASFAGSASAATSVTVGSGWHVFGYDWSGNEDGIPVLESPFTFTASSPVVVTVTAIGCVGDRFTISDGATTLGMTSPPLRFNVFGGGCEYAGFTADPDTALADPNYSHGRFAVGTGARSIGILVDWPQANFGGVGAIRVDTMTKDDCKQGGWQDIAASPTFQNQGDCVSFVATTGRNLSH